MNNWNSANYDEISAPNNPLHRTPFFLVFLSAGVLENKSSQCLPLDWIRYNITDNYLCRFHY